MRNDKDEPVDDGPQKAKAEPVLKPSEALKPKVNDFASPITDHFFMRLTYFPASVTTTFRVDPDAQNQGTTLSGEDDLGLDDKIDQGRMEFDIRMANRGHIRVDYFKLNRFKQQPLPRDIVFGDFTFDEGTTFRSKLDWRVLTFTYTTPSSRPKDSRAALHWPQHHPDGRRRRRARHAQSGEDHRCRNLPHHRGDRRVPDIEALVGNRAGGNSSRPAPMISTA